jgi:hypothetical protein
MELTIQIALGLQINNKIFSATLYIKIDYNFVKLS